MSKEDENDLTSFFGSPISVYTSKQAEEDGILVATGHKLINYITATVYHKCVEPFIESLAITRLSIANKPLEVTDADRKKAERELIKKLLDSAILEIVKLKRQDWFYNIEVRGWDLFCAQNETGGYTLMFPEDY
jgi:hypothetical protein